jgi:hypothetical protein
VLTENDVVDAMCEWLERNGLRVESYCKDSKPGDDIHAVDEHGRNLFVECKGAVSKSGNNLNHWANVAGCFFNAVRDAVVLRPADTHAIAIPDIAELHGLLDGLVDTLLGLGIAVFWVSDGLTVSAYWPRASRLSVVAR